MQLAGGRTVVTGGGGGLARRSQARWPPPACTCSSPASVADRPVRVACVAPGWIGLPRAFAERAAMPADGRPDLIPPGRVAAEVLALVTARRSAGRVVVIE